MDRKLCLNKEDKLLYKIVCEAIGAICGMPMIVYHYIEDNGLVLIMELERFNKEFIRLGRE